MWTGCINKALALDNKASFLFLQHGCSIETLPALLAVLRPLRLRLRRAPLAPSKTPKLHPRALPAPLQHAPQRAQLFLQSHARTIIRLGIQDLVNVGLRLRGPFGGVGREGLGQKLDVQGGLHQLWEGNGRERGGRKGADERGGGCVEEGAEDARGQGCRRGACFCVDDDEVEEHGEDVGAGFAVGDAVGGRGRGRPRRAGDSVFDGRVDFGSVWLGVRLEKLGVELGENVSDACGFVGELHGEEGLEE